MATVDPSLVAHLPPFAGFAAEQLVEILREARSMLFPKPLGFKFYRDSMRFIGVLTGIAMLGFMVSAVQFVRLGVSALLSPIARLTTTICRSNGKRFSSVPLT